MATVDVAAVGPRIAPADPAAVALALAEAHASGTPVYPVGGATSLRYGLPPARPGIELSTSALNRVIDYPARDMTITLESGVTMEVLGKTLAAEGQWLPIDAPAASSATIGGLMATAWSGPRRYKYGTPRDYVIGITAVDGRGTPFSGGGRVVKNVAGYDFCKLLTGSMGTLGVITQLSLKIRPRPAASAFLIADLPGLDVAERLLAALVTSATSPVAVELLTGPAWREHEVLGWSTAGTAARLVVGLEGTLREVEWMLVTLAREWEQLGVPTSREIQGAPVDALWRDLTEFSAGEAPLVVKASVPAGRTTDLIREYQKLDPTASIQAHAGNGIVIARFSNIEPADVSRMLVGRIHPLAEAAGGHAVVLSTTLEGLTRQATWGNVTPAMPWMARVKQQFDPKNILNPGRFVYAE